MKALICSSLHLRGVTSLPFDPAASAPDALFIAGGLFDDHCFTDDLYNALYNCFSALSGTHIFICPGASDPYIASSPYVLRDWPENVHIFKNRMKAFEISAKEASGDAAVRVYGIGASRHRPGICPLVTDRLPKTDPAFLNILILPEAPRDNDGNIDTGLLEKAGFDAFIFGSGIDADCSADGSTALQDNIILVSGGVTGMTAGTITKNFPPYGFLPAFPAEAEAGVPNPGESAPDYAAELYRIDPVKANIFKNCEDAIKDSALAKRLLFDALCGNEIPEVTGK